MRIEIYERYSFQLEGTHSVMRKKRNKRQKLQPKEVREDSLGCWNDLSCVCWELGNDGG